MMPSALRIYKPTSQRLANYHFEAIKTTRPILFQIPDILGV